MIQNKKSPHYSRKHNRQTVIYIVLGVLVALCLAVGLYFFFTRSSDNLGKDSETKPLGVSETTKSAENESAEAASNPESRAPKQYEGDAPESTGTISGIITIAEKDEYGFINIYTTIPETAIGTCEFTLSSPSGQTVSATTSLERDPSASYCQNPHFESSQFNIGGIWTIVIRLSAGDKSGSITGEVNL